MSYVDNNLMPGEQVLHRAQVHWVIYGPGVLYIVLAFAAYIYAPYLARMPVDMMPLIAVAGFGWLGVIMLVKAFIYRQTTEFAVTNLRVVAKVGWISRNVVELRFNKIEGLNMEQSVWGRILNFGTLVLSGTGGDKTYINTIGDPSHFCNHAMATIGAAG